MKKLIALVFGMLAMGSSAVAQPSSPNNALIYYNFDGQTGAQNSSAGTSLVPDLIATSITRSSGINAVALNDSINSNGWTTDTMRNPDQYYTFQVYWSGNSLLNMTSIQYRTATDYNGPQKLDLYYSLDGFSTPGTLLASQAIARGGSVLNAPVDLSTHSDLQNLVSGKTIDFRLYAYEAKSRPFLLEFGQSEESAQQLAFVNDSPSSTNIASSGVFVSGFITPVPEPGAILIVCAVCGGIAGFARRSVFPWSDTTQTTSPTID